MWGPAALEEGAPGHCTPPASENVLATHAQRRRGRGHLWTAVPIVRASGESLPAGRRDRMVPRPSLGAGLGSSRFHQPRMGQAAAFAAQRAGAQRSWARAWDWASLAPQGLVHRPGKGSGQEQQPGGPGLGRPLRQRGRAPGHAALISGALSPRLRPVRGALHPPPLPLPAPCPPQAKALLTPPSDPPGEAP